jgi:hypothetical protein
MGSVVARPETPFEVGDGYEWRAVVDDDWRLWGVDGFRCLARVDGERCPNDAVAVLMRRARAGRRPYRYCAEHMYGRWIEDGGVMMWVVRKSADTAEATDDAIREHPLPSKNDPLI